MERSFWKGPSSQDAGKVIVNHIAKIDTSVSIWDVNGFLCLRIWRVGLGCPKAKVYDRPDLETLSRVR
jgi:hypothetical protein